MSIKSISSNLNTSIVVTFYDQFRFSQLKREAIELQADGGCAFLYPETNQKLALEFHTILHKMGIRGEDSKCAFVAHHIKGCNGCSIYLTSEKLERINQIFAQRLSESDKNELKAVLKRLNEALNPPTMIPVFGHSYEDRWYVSQLHNLCACIENYVEKGDASLLAPYLDLGSDEKKMSIAEFFYHQIKPDTRSKSRIFEDFTMRLEDLTWCRSAPGLGIAVKDAFKLLRKIDQNPIQVKPLIDAEE